MGLTPALSRAEAVSTLLAIRHGSEQSRSSSSLRRGR
jgi:hypothetical protein